MALCEEILELEGIDSPIVDTFLSHSPGVVNAMVALQCHELLLEEGKVPEAIKMRKLLGWTTDSCPVSFSNPADRRLVKALKGEGTNRHFLDYFKPMTDKELITLMEMKLDNETLIKLLFDQSSMIYVSPDCMLMMLVKIAKTCPNVSRYATILMLLLTETVKYLPKGYDISQLLLAFELRGIMPLNLLGNLRRSDAVWLYQEMFLGGHFDRFCEVFPGLHGLLRLNAIDLPLPQIQDLIKQSPEFEQFLLENPEQFNRIINQGNIYKIHSRSILCKFYGFETFLQLLETLSLDQLRSCSNFIAIEGSFAEIKVFFARLNRFADKWKFVAQFIGGSVAPDFLQSLDFILGGCSKFDSKSGITVTTMKAERFAEILSKAPKLLDLLAKGPFGVVTNVSEVQKLLQNDSYFQLMLNSEILPQDRAYAFFHKCIEETEEFSPLEYSRLDQMFPSFDQEES